MFESQKTTFQVNASLCREDTLDGHKYMVFPGVMITEGVHNGSKGPLFYPKEELSPTVNAWNMKPIVIRHPKEKDGTPISACTPEVIEKQGVGVLFNTVFSDEDSKAKMKMEAWFDKEKTDKVAPGLLTAFRSGKPHEVSTGLFSNNEEVEGVWNGEQYSGIARDITPDHLAIIMEGKGACSVAAGAGIPRINEEQKEEIVVLKEKVEQLEKKLEEVNNEQRKESPMNKETVERLKSGGISDEALTALEGLDEKDVKILDTLMEEIPAPDPDLDSDPVDNGDNRDDEDKPLTANEYVENAPAEIRSVLNHSLALHKTQKAALVKVITDNENNTFSEEVLANKEISELESIVALVPKLAGDFSALADTVSLIENTETPMETPTLAKKK